MVLWQYTSSTGSRQFGGFFRFASLTLPTVLWWVGHQQATEPSGTITTLDVVGQQDASGNIVSMRMQFFLAEELEEISGEEDSDPEIIAWEESQSILIRDTNWGPIAVYSLTRWEIDEEGGSAIQNDVQLLIFGYILLVLYATFVLSRNSTVHSYGSLALVSFFSSGLATAACFGLGIYLGLEFSNVIQTLAFLLLGLGMDDTFVLMGAFDHPDVRKLDGKVRLSSCVSHDVTHCVWPYLAVRRGNSGLDNIACQGTVQKATAT